MLFAQVSIVAIQLIGDELHHGVEHNNDHVVHTNAATASQNVPPSVCDDLAFEMYVDRDVAKTIRLLEQRKHQAVQGTQI